MAEPMSLDIPLADRISARGSNNNRGRGGPNQGGNQSRRNNNRASPYTRPSPAPDGQWKHDKFAEHNGIRGGSLAARLSGGGAVSGNGGGGGAGGRSAAGQVDSSRVVAALRQATSQPRTNAGGKAAISIKGASGSTVQVKELASGTTPADVEMIFSQCGKILSSKLGPDPQDEETVTIHVKFSKREDALKAVKTFHGQQADGRLLSVTILEETGILDRFDAQRVAPEMDLLLSADSGSGMRSDSLVNAPGAQVLTAPPKVAGGRR